jgi:hypothetical protein
MRIRVKQISILQWVSYCYTHSVETFRTNCINVIKTIKLSWNFWRIYFQLTEIKSGSHYVRSKSVQNCSSRRTISMVIYTLDHISIIWFLSVILQSPSRRRFLTDRSHSIIVKWRILKRWLLNCIVCISDWTWPWLGLSNIWIRAEFSHIFTGSKRIRIRPYQT